MANDDGIQLLLDFAKQARRVDARKVPVDVFVNNLDERQKLSHGQIGFHSLNACALPGLDSLRAFFFVNVGSKCTTLLPFCERGAYEKDNEYR